MDGGRWRRKPWRAQGTPDGGSTPAHRYSKFTLLHPCEVCALKILHGDCLIARIGADSRAIEDHSRNAWVDFGIVGSWVYGFAIGDSVVVTDWVAFGLKGSWEWSHSRGFCVVRGWRGLKGSAWWLGFGGFRQSRIKRWLPMRCWQTR